MSRRYRQAHPVANDHRRAALVLVAEGAAFLLIVIVAVLLVPVLWPVELAR